MAGNGDGVAAFAAEELAREANRQRLVPETRSALELDPDVRAWPLSWEQDRHVAYFYLSKSLLTRDRDLPRVRDALQALGALPDEQAGSSAASPATDDHALIAGISRLDVQVRDTQHTPDVVADLDSRLGIGVATHEHAFIITPNTMCPATEPEAVITPQHAENPAAVRAALWPAIGDPSAGADVRVSVVDTGLIDGRQRVGPVDPGR